MQRFCEVKAKVKVLRFYIATIMASTLWVRSYSRSPICMEDMPFTRKGLNYVSWYIYTLYTNTDLDHIPPDISPGRFHPILMKKRCLNRNWTDE